MLSAYKPNSNCTKVISRFYENIMECKGKLTLYVKSKWEDEVNVEITVEDMCAIQHTSTRSHQWRVFNWKNLIRFFITTKIQSKKSTSHQPCWSQCGSLNAHHSNIFWSCEGVKCFWESVHSVLIAVLGYEIPFSCTTLDLGQIT